MDKKPENAFKSFFQSEASLPCRTQGFRLAPTMPLRESLSRLTEAEYLEIERAVEP
jgi:hypothetical protein